MDSIQSQFLIYFHTHVRRSASHSIYTYNIWPHLYLYSFSSLFVFIWAFLNFETNIITELVPECSTWSAWEFPQIPFVSPFSMGGVSLWRSRFQNGFSKTVSLFDQLLTITDRFSSPDSVYILSNFRNDVIFSIFGSNSSGATPLNFRWLHVNNQLWVPLFFAISCSSRYILSSFYAQFWLSLVLRLLLALLFCSQIAGSGSLLNSHCVQKLPCCSRYILAQ